MGDQFPQLLFWLLGLKVIVMLKPCGNVWFIIYAQSLVSMHCSMTLALNVGGTDLDAQDSASKGAKRLPTPLGYALVDCGRTCQHLRPLPLSADTSCCSLVTCMGSPAGEDAVV